MSKFIIEKSQNKENTFEVWKKNKKGFYNFIKYIASDEIENFKHEHKNDEITEKYKTN